MTDLTLTQADRILVLAPHPDDETLATGGLLQRALGTGAEVRVVFVTDGENNPWAQRATEHRWRIRAADRERWGERRRNEALAALGCLGIDSGQVTFLGYPDQGLHRLLVGGDLDLIESVAGELERFRPTTLVAPALEDLHPDHSALAVLTRLALARIGPGATRPRERLFVVHHDGPLHAPAPTARLRLTQAEREGKRRAILCHASQLRLRRRALMAFAGEEELFFPAGGPAEACPGHPARRAILEGDALHLDLVRRTRPGAFGDTEVLLVLERPGGRQTLVARLPRLPGPVQLFDPIRGALVARGELRRPSQRLPSMNGGSERVTLPASLLAGALHAFVKLERRFGFFDEAGWRALPCAPATPIRATATRAEAAGLQVAAVSRPARRQPR